MAVNCRAGTRACRHTGAQADGRVVVVTGATDELWRQGFGTIETAERIRAILAGHWRESRLAVVDTQAQLQELIDDPPDLVFSGISYLPGVSAPESPGARIWVSQHMAQAGINYTGSIRSALELTIDKGRAKSALLKNAVPTAPFFVATPGLYRSAGELPLELPLFVKPLYEGDGRGIGADSVARTFAGYERKVGAIMEEWGQPALVETYLAGREFTVARLGGEDEDPTLLPLELVGEAGELGERILGFEAKLANRERARAVPAGRLRERLLALSRATLQALTNRDYGRIDLRMDGAGNLYVLEANFIPGLTEQYSYFPLACAVNRGLTYQETIVEIARIAAARNLSVAT